MSDEIIVIGHKNPDTDSVVSAFVWSSLLNKIGVSARPAIAGEANKETEVVFEKAGVKLPEEINLEDREVFLVDHNEKSQMADGVKEIVGVIDHHKLCLKTDHPIFFRNEPLGSTSSVIRKIAIEKGIDLEKKETFLLLAGIISDTLKFNSPTTTNDDKELAKDLANLSGYHIDELADEMFVAKSDLSGMSLMEIIEGDYKDFELGGKKVGVGVCEITSPSFFKGKNESIIEEMKKVKKNNNLDFLLFGVVDILKKNTLLYVCSNKEKDLVKKVFNVQVEENPAILKGIASRKKQIIPPLSEFLNE